MALLLDTERKILLLRLKATNNLSNATISEEIACCAKSTPYIIIDLKNERISSMGIGSLVNISNSYQKIWEKRFLPINLFNIHPQVRQLIEKAGLSAIFRLWDSLDECYKSLEGSR